MSPGNSVRPPCFGNVRKGMTRCGIALKSTRHHVAADALFDRSVMFHSASSGSKTQDSEVTRS